MTEQNSTLIHYGIPGQKWGERNYQYEDGSLTPEGLRRYRHLTNKIDKYHNKLNKRLRKQSKLYEKHYSGDMSLEEMDKKDRKLQKKIIKAIAKISKYERKLMSEIDVESLDAYNDFIIQNSLEKVKLK